MPKHAHLELQNNGRINIKIQSIELIAEILAIAAFGITAAIGALSLPFDLPPNKKGGIIHYRTCSTDFRCRARFRSRNPLKCSGGPVGQGPLGVIAEKRREKRKT